MKSLKSHISVILPLFVLLFSLQFTLLTNKIVQEYSKKLTQDYSIVVVAPKPLSTAVVKSKISGIQSIEEISSKKILNRLKGNISSKNISLLKIALPKFYSIKLESFPSAEEIERIEEKLLKSGLATKVETFSQTHNRVYGMFHALKTTALLFLIFIFVISILLMFKQMRIWILEHRERMSIMTLFGATSWMKSAPLYRLTIIDSFISTALVVIAYLIFPKLEFIDIFARSMDIVIPEFDIVKDTIILLGISLVFSLFIVFAVIRKMSRE